jgi:hypothetical protein
VRITEGSQTPHRTVRSGGRKRPVPDTAVIAINMIKGDEEDRLGNDATRVGADRQESVRQGEEDRRNTAGIAEGGRP